MAEQDHSTQLLLAASNGDREAFDRLFAQVYDELRDIAHHRLKKVRPGETLNTTALVHEAYLKIVDQTQFEWQNRAHFFALASRAMRFILVNHAEARAAQKRGGGVDDLPLDEVQIVVDEQATELLALHEALEQLGGLNERLGALVEYRFFGGLSCDEIAEVTGLSVPTVKRDWTRAKGWLHRFMQTAPPAKGSPLQHESDRPSLKRPSIIKATVYDRSTNVAPSIVRCCRVSAVKERERVLPAVLPHDLT